MKRFFVILLFCAGAITMLFAQDAVTSSLVTSRPHAPMEILGVGPEMFQDRGIAWIKACAAVLNELIASVGIIAVAIILMVKNVRNTDLKDRLDRVGERTDKNSEQIASVALAVPVATEQAKAIL